jgi:uncharacterized protein YndB with AHSA1/START domain
MPEDAPVRREIDVDATPEEVWEALVTDEGRERWLDDAEREVDVEVVEPPSRLVWWWGGERGEPPSRVEFEVVAAPGGARVVVTESEPAFPITLLAASLAAVPV